jgi:regulation of enolase protein 1 (concanavalin A-like superfamily)
MNRPLQRFSVLALAGISTVLLLAAQSAVAQQSSEQQPASRFVTGGGLSVKLDRIVAVTQRTVQDGRTTDVRILVEGVPQPFILEGRDADRFFANFTAMTGGDQTGGRATQAEGPASSEGLVLLAYDGFDGKLALNWKPVRPDPSHVSLTKTKGALTITTQRGSIHRRESEDTLSEGTKAKNIYVIDNPLAPGADFVVTTCVSGFTPEMVYQQAGLIIYNDDDNYVKFGYEYNWQRQGGQAFCILTETDANSDFHYIDQDLSGLKRYWVQIAKRGNSYEYLTRTDSKSFRSHGEVQWGDGSPKQIGILAKNGGSKEAGELDANFEFFELRAPASQRIIGPGSN